MNNTQKSIDRVCDYRGVPKVKKGMTCTVDGRKGKIVGGNTSANFNVKFEDSKRVMNCHPYWKMRIFDESGNVHYDHSADKAEQEHIIRRLAENGIDIDELETEA